MKTVIINGSPRKNGETAYLISALRRRLNGEVTELSAYRDKVIPCVDCRYCWQNKGCKISDDMDIIYADDYENIIIASPVYMSALTPPMMNIASRLQLYYSAKRKLNDEIVLKRKKGGLMLTAGGDGSPTQAMAAAKLIFRILKADFDESSTVLSLNTDITAAKDDVKATNAVVSLAQILNGGTL